MSKRTGKCKLPEFETITITPEMARKYLERNTLNRPLSDKRINRYIREFQAGYWKVNGESIKFAKDGRILDGQHRLWACVLSGKSFRTDVRRNLDPKVFATIDCGGMRSGADALSIKQVTNARTIAPAIQHIYKYCNDKYKWTNISCNRVQILEFYNQFKEISDSVEYGRHSAHLITAAVGTAFHFLFSKVHRTDADAFFYGMATGEFDAGMTAIRFCRERFIKSGMDPRRDRKIPTMVKTAMIIKAWNAFHGELAVRVIKYSDSEAFPEIKGIPRKIIEAFRDDHCISNEKIEWPDGKKPGSD